MGTELMVATSLPEAPEVLDVATGGGWFAGGEDEDVDDEELCVSESAGDGGSEGEGVRVEEKCVLGSRGCLSSTERLPGPAGSAIWLTLRCAAIEPNTPELLIRCMRGRA
jgi:hypothetical protein